MTSHRAGTSHRPYKYTASVTGITSNGHCLAVRTEASGKTCQSSFHCQLEWEEVTDREELQETSSFSWRCHWKSRSSFHAMTAKSEQVLSRPFSRLSWKEICHISFLKFGKSSIQQLYLLVKEKYFIAVRNSFQKFLLYPIWHNHVNWLVPKQKVNVYLGLSPREWGRCLHSQALARRPTRNVLKKSCKLFWHAVLPAK